MSNHCLEDSHLAGAVTLALMLASGFTILAADPMTSASSSSRVGRALLVGCTSYDHQKKWSLKGPANDVRLMQRLLRDRFGFEDTHVRALAEGEEFAGRPVKSNILREVAALTEAVQPGDRVVLFLAGHGSQQPNNDPDNPDDPEPDGLDELFLPADVAGLNGKEIQNAILDDDIGSWIQTLRNKGADVWFIADSCHSGTLTRGDTSEEESEAVRVRSLPPEALGISVQSRPPNVLLNHKQSWDLPYTLPSSATRGGNSFTSRSPVTLAALYAAQPAQTTPDMRLPNASGDHQGLLTYSLYRSVTSADHPLTYRELYESIRESYLRLGVTSPAPLIDGPDADLDRIVLGDAWREMPPLTLRVSNRGSTYTIDAGTLHGLHEGTILSVAPPAGQSGGTIGYLRIRDAKEISANAIPCAWQDTPRVNNLPDFGRCDVVLQTFGDFRLRVVSLDEASASFLASVAEKYPFIVTVEDRQQADVIVKMDSVVNHFLLLDPADVGEEHPIERGTRITVTEKLRDVAKYRNLLRLSAEQSLVASPRLKIDLQIWSYGTGTDPVDNKPKNSEGTPVTTTTIPDGTWIRFHLKNTGKSEADVTLLFLNENYEVIDWFPDENISKDNRLKPGIEVFTQAGRLRHSVGSEHLIMIAVPSNGRGNVDFRYLAKKSAAGSSERGGGGSVEIRDVLELACCFEGIGTRSPGTRSHGGQALVKSLSWKVEGEARPNGSNN